MPEKHRLAVVAGHRKRREREKASNVTKIADPKRLAQIRKNIEEGGEGRDPGWVGYEQPLMEMLEAMEDGKPLDWWRGVCGHHWSKSEAEHCPICARNELAASLAAQKETAVSILDLLAESDAKAFKLAASLAAACLALKPFATYASGFGEHGRDDDWVLSKSTSGKRTITMGDVRQAARILGGTK